MIWIVEKKIHGGPKRVSSIEGTEYIIYRELKSWRQKKLSQGKILFKQVLLFKVR